jgi:hypothetical protein
MEYMMAMSKKHYETFAATVKMLIESDAPDMESKDFYTARWASGAKARAVTLANTFATMAANDNPRFNRAKFLQACGL